MSDKFEDISDEELIAEYEERDLGEDCDCAGEVEDAVDEAIEWEYKNMEEMFFDSGKMKKLAELLRSGNQNDLNKYLSDEIYEAVGIIC